MPEEIHGRCWSVKLPILFSRLNRDPKRLRRIGGLAALGLLLALVCLVPRLADPYDCRILDGVSIGGLDVGGMTRFQARSALKKALDETLLGRDLVIALPDGAVTVSPEEAGLQVRVWDAVRDAYRVGRSEGEPNSTLGLLDNIRFDSSALEEAADACAGACGRTLAQPTWRLEGTRPELATDRWQEDAPCQTLVITKGTPEIRLDVQVVLDGILAVYDMPVSAAAAGEYGFSIPALTPLALPEEPDLEAIAAQVCSEPVDDSLDLDTYAFVPGAYGYGFSTEQVREALAAADWGQDVSIPLSCTAPEILGQAAYFRDLLGACQTRHNDNENRNTNLRLICQILDGHVVEPGETFSFNDVVGQRTAERGFKPAPAYSGNRLVDSVGGGACQTSTTLYNCVLLGDLEVVTRLCHGASVGYVPLGLDAAVNWGTTDFAFRNNFHFPVKIRAEVSDGYVKMELWGTDEKDYYIEMTSNYDDSGETAIYAVSYKNKYDKQTGQLISREREAFSTYYKNIG